MRTPGLPREASERLLIVVFAILVGSFLVATIVAQRLSSRVSTLTDSLTETAMPRIEHVAELRDATLEVQLELADFVHRTGDARARVRPMLDARLATFKSQVRRDLAHNAPFLLSTEMSSALANFEDAVERTRAVVDRDPDAARTLAQSDLLPAANRLGDRAMREIELGAQHGLELALSLQHTRGQLMWLSYGLIATCTIVAGGGIFLLRRRAARNLAAVGAYARDQEIKAEEMEQFAGRVAHDIQGPLSAAGLASELLAEEPQSEEGKFAIVRLQRSLARTSAIVDGLLAFARAGANPEPGARVAVREYVSDVAESLGRELARTEIDLVVEPLPPVLVACSSGVLLSMLGNLVRNAIKYMGDAQPRRITIRAVERNGAVRVEVTDTGPGVAEDVIPRLFEPYFRVAATNKQPGLGLGLPTVRKLAEGHGGRAGVTSVVGAGSTFWFELPYAGSVGS